MKDVRLSRVKMVFVIAATAVVLCYVYFVAPFFMDRIETNVTENKQMEYDLELIERMDGDTAPIKDSIDAGNIQLAEFEKSINTDGSEIDMDVSAKADDAGVTITEIAVEDPEIAGEKSVERKILYRQPMAVSFNSSFKKGVAFMNRLENSDTCIYRVRDFLFSSDDDAMWVINVDAFYYKER